MLSAKQKEILEAAGGKYWEKMDRYYFEAADLINVTQYSKNDQWKLRQRKIYIDTDCNAFVDRGEKATDYDGPSSNGFFKPVNILAIALVKLATEAKEK